MGRTRDEINLRSFLGIKSGWSAKFGLQPGERPRPLRERDTPTRERGIMRIFNLCFAPLYFTRRWWNGLFSHDSSFLRGLDVIYRNLYQASFKIRVDSLFFYLHPFLSSLFSHLLSIIFFWISLDNSIFISTCLRSVLYIAIHFSFVSERISIVRHHKWRSIYVRL